MDDATTHGQDSCVSASSIPFSDSDGRLQSRWRGAYFPLWSICLGRTVVCVCNIIKDFIAFDNTDPRKMAFGNHPFPHRGEYFSIWKILVSFWPLPSSLISTDLQTHHILTHHTLTEIGREQTQLKRCLTRSRRVDGKHGGPFGNRSMELPELHAEIAASLHMQHEILRRYGVAKNCLLEDLIRQWNFAKRCEVTGPCLK